MSTAVSTARIDITPTSANQCMAGYGGTGPRLNTSTYSPLTARCVVIWDNGNPNAIVSADVLGWPRSMHQAIRQQVLALTTWTTADFALLSTHTHNGPVLLEMPDPTITYNLTDTTGVAAYSSWLQARIVSLVQTALAAQSEASRDRAV